MRDFDFRNGRSIGRPCQAVTTSIDDNDFPTRHYRSTRYRFVRDAGAAMAAPLKVAEVVHHYILTKIDGTYVDSRNETPSGVTFSQSNGIASITIDNTLLPANETVFVEFFMGESMG